ncbi:hypothetical protein, partial [Cardinium endosymbiont of Culicoides punctatus]|uniref:hypothetical protein n=1 Tax=Cardinium endosymbiont of Culicoides punctatus TaxID=2304601 RepID=UPI0010591C86
MVQFIQKTFYASIVFILHLLFAPVSYANIEYQGYQSKLGHPSWTTCLCDYPDYKQYKAPTNITVNGCNWGTWVTFPQKIEAIQAIVGSYTNPIEFFRSKDFLAMYMHNDYYYDAALDYLFNSCYTLEQKKFVIYAMGGKSASLCTNAYKLYKSHKIDLQLLTLICSIHVSNIMKYDHGYKNVASTLKNSSYVRDTLLVMQQNLPKESELYVWIQELFNNRFPESLCSLMYADDLLYQKYGSKGGKLPYYEIITRSVKDYKQWQQYLLHYSTMPLNISVPAYFLMVLEHPAFYYPFQFGPYSGLKNGVDILRDPEYSPEEKSMAILAMSQLDATNYA